MIAKHLCLYQYLTQRNPVLDVENGCEGQNTKSQNGAWKEPSSIIDWADFQLEWLRSTHDSQLAKILSKTVECPESPTIASFPFCEIHDEASLESLLTLWSHQIVSNALKIAQDNLGSPCTPDRVYMIRGGQAELLRAHRKNGTKSSSHPDWGAVKKVGDWCNRKGLKMKLNNILPGDTKLSTKWMSADVERGNRDQYTSNMDTARPVLQVFNYCIRAHARYGYIITDHELVVLRVTASTEMSAACQVQEEENVSRELLDGTINRRFGRKGSKAEAEERASNNGESQESQDAVSHARKKARRSGKVELKSIPWSSHDEGSELIGSQLTINLALWWLHLMARAEASSGVEDSMIFKDELSHVSTSNNTSFSAKVASLELAAAPSLSEAGFRDDDRKRKLPSSDTRKAKVARKT